MRFVVVNSSSTPFDPVDLGKMAAGLEIQLNRDFATHWGGNYVVRYAGSPVGFAPDEIVASLVDSLPTNPGAIAFHSIAGDALPMVFVAVSMTNGKLLEGDNSVSVSLSHEFTETAADPGCNRWADDGVDLRAIEVADPTESDTYDLEINGWPQTVSNFVLPSFFSPGSQPPYSFLGVDGVDPIKAPFQTAPGGYQLVRQGAGPAAAVDGFIDAARLAKKQHWSSRTYRRGARV